MSPAGKAGKAVSVQYHVFVGAACGAAHLARGAEDRWCGPAASFQCVTLHIAIAIAWACRWRLLWTVRPDCQSAYAGGLALAAG